MLFDLGLYIDADGNKLYVEARGNNIKGFKRTPARWDEDLLELVLIEEDHISPETYEQRLIDYLDEHGWTTTTDLNAAGGRGDETLAARKRLVEKGQIHRKSSQELGRVGTAKWWNLRNPSNHEGSDPSRDVGNGQDRKSVV